jgi:hypothetical protein
LITTRVATGELAALHASRLRVAALVVSVQDPGPWSGTSATGKERSRIPSSAPLEAFALGASATDLAIELVVLA